jgi:hypothetical protein
MWRIFVPRVKALLLRQRPADEHNGPLGSGYAGRTMQNISQGLARELTLHQADEDDFGHSDQIAVRQRKHRIGAPYGKQRLAACGSDFDENSLHCQFPPDEKEKPGIAARLRRCG